MRPYLILFFSGFIFSSSFSQYYLRGQLKDENGNGLQGSRIALYSKGNYPYFTGNDGVFGLPSSLKIDTITFMLDGYDTLRVPAITSQYGNFVLKAARKKISNALFLSSLTKNFPYQNLELLQEDEKHPVAFLQNPIINTTNYPQTSIGLHVNKAGYSNIKRILNNHEQPSADEVKIEEMLSHFNIKTREADPGKVFTFNSQITSCPWNNQSRLLFINILANKVNLDKTPPANIVFLIDASGSMEVINRLPLIKSAFKLLTENLRSIDKVSIITYGDVVTQLLPATSGSEKQKIIETIEGLRPYGNTPGASAIRMAYLTARENFIKNGNNRIILATDGDFNVGETNAKGLVELAGRESKDGIYLSCLGVGMTKDNMLEDLAKAGQGHFAYLDNETDAEKIMVEEFMQVSYAVANDVYLDVHFDAGEVKEYRLIGFCNSKSAVNANVTNLAGGGQVGSGQSILAAFEISSPNVGSAPIAKVQLSYQLPGRSDILNESYEVIQNFQPLESLNNSYRFASSVITFGEMLKQSKYYEDFTWSDLEHLATSAIIPGDLLQNEFLEMITKARKIYPARRRNK